jgi:hypothetical protein
VMELQINFGWPGLVLGFLCLGWLLGWLDRCAALEERSGALDRTVLFFLPAVALIQPIGSLVELFGGTAAAAGAAYAWKLLWNWWSHRAGPSRRGAGMVANQRPRADGSESPTSNRLR